MNLKLKGILTIIGTLIALILMTFVVGFIISATSSDGWAGLGAIIMMLFVTIIVMLVFLVIGIVKYYKTKSEFGLGLIYGIVGILIFGGAMTIISYLYNSIV